MMPTFYVFTWFLRNVGEELADEGDQVGAAVTAAQTKVISQVGVHNYAYTTIDYADYTSVFFSGKSEA